MRVWKFGDDVNTDLITPGRYTFTTDPAKLGKISFIEQRPEFAREVKVGDVIVAGKNFGCGSSREHAPIALKAAGISAIIAGSFARIFYRNAINIGLLLLVCEKVDEIDDGGSVEIDFESGEVYDKTKGIIVKAKPPSRFILEIVKKGGLINYLRSGGYV